ncbi:hypothetical protein Droror1_Dr00001383 [Drosera rotundifolia]
MRPSAGNEKNYFIGRFGSGLPTFGTKKKSSDTRWTVKKEGLQGRQVTDTLKPSSPSATPSSPPPLASSAEFVKAINDILPRSIRNRGDRCKFVGKRLSPALKRDDLKKLKTLTEYSRRTMEYTRKKVTFDSNITSYKHVSVDEVVVISPHCGEVAENLMVGDSVKATNSASVSKNGLVSSYRYQSYQEDEDEDEEEELHREQLHWFSLYLYLLFVFLLILIWILHLKLPLNPPYLEVSPLIPLLGGLTFDANVPSSYCLE